MSVLAGNASGDSYEDGKNGVSASIHFCSGSRDATITTYAGTREIEFTFSAPSATLNGSVPDWAPGTFMAPFFFNIRNILCHDEICPNPFTTRMNWRFQRSDRKSYRLRFCPLVAETPDLHSPDMAVNEPDINLPYETSYVSVLHQPGNCPDGMTYDQWDVVADNFSPNGSCSSARFTWWGTRGRIPPATGGSSRCRIAAR